MLKGRCDSFVVETNVHYPTDINLLFDAMRKVITLVSTLCAFCSMTEWRQSRHNIKTVKRLFRKTQKLKRSTSKDPAKQEEREKIIIAAHLEYIDVARSFLEKARSTITKVNSGGAVAIAITFAIENFIAHAERQIEQIDRQVIKGEKIPHNEKVFSIFETHTEWDQQREGRCAGRENQIRTPMSGSAMFQKTASRHTLTKRSNTEFYYKIQHPERS